jgi:predicted DNA binding protein
LRKLIVNLHLNAGLEFIPGKISDNIESLKLLEMLKMDFNKSIIIGIYEITVKKGFIIEDIKIPHDIQFFDILKTDGNKYTCFIKRQYHDELSKNCLKELDLELIWVKLEKCHENIIKIGVIGENNNLNMLLEILKKYGETNIICFSKANFERHHILSSLTNKQKEVLLAAKRNGYYDYPRSINSFQLSKKIGISKATAIEHLRKAEKRLISQILINY